MPGRQLVREVGHLLGLRRRRRACRGQSSGASRAATCRDVALVRERAAVGRPCQADGTTSTATTATGPSTGRRPRPQRREQRERAEDDDQVAQRPRGRAVARVGVRRSAGATTAMTATASDPRGPVRRPRSAATTSPTPAAGSSRASARWPLQIRAIARTSDRPVGRCDHGAPVCAPGRAASAPTARTAAPRRRRRSRRRAASPRRSGPTTTSASQASPAAPTRNAPHACV